MCNEATHLMPITKIQYGQAVEEFDRLWEAATTEAQQSRMLELLKQIEAFERLANAS